MRLALSLPLLSVLLAACPTSEEPDGGTPPDGGDGDSDADADTDADADGDGGPGPLPDGGLGFHLGTFRFAPHSLAYEPSYPGTPSATLFTCQSEAIAVVTPRFAEALAREHRGFLEDARIVQEDGTLPGGGPCYAVMDPALAPWGRGEYGRPLEPFRSVFLDPTVAPDGRWLFVPELYGLTTPGEERGLSFPHDGCVRVDDPAATGEEVGLWSVLPAYGDALARAIPSGTVELYQDSTYCPGAL